MQNIHKQHAFTLIELVTVLALMACCLYFFKQKFVNTSGKIVKTSTEICESIINSARWHAINKQEKTYFFVETSQNEKNFCKHIGFLTKNASQNIYSIQQEVFLPENTIIVHENYFSQIGINHAETTNFILEENDFYVKDETKTMQYITIDPTGNLIDTSGNKKNSLLIFASGKYIYQNSTMELLNITQSEGVRPIVILNNGKILHITRQQLSDIADKI